MFTRRPAGPSTAVQSKDVVGVVNGYYTTHDLNYTSIR